MVYLLKMVIFHGYVSHNQRVILVFLWFFSIPLARRRASAHHSARCSHHGRPHGLCPRESDPGISQASGHWEPEGIPIGLKVCQSQLFAINMAMDQYLLIPFLGGWTSIYQLSWCELQGYKVLTHCHMVAKHVCYKDYIHSHSQFLFMAKPSQLFVM
jgi:hypothetical protein